MGIRAFLQANPTIAKVGSAFVILVALIQIVLAQRGRPVPVAPHQAFFSVDDGATYFADDIHHIPPYLHDGKEAVRANVIQGATGKPFVAYLFRYSAEARGTVERLASQNGASVAELLSIQTDGMEVKKPLSADAQWIPAMSQAASAVIEIRPPPDVSEPLQPLLP